MNDRERLDALETALGNEMKEREFYLRNADRTQNPLGKAMFRRIAEDELDIIGG
jgi:rubrerythrin